MKTRIAIVDDHPVIIAGFEQLLSSLPEFELVGTARDSTQLVEMLAVHALDVVITDFSMPAGRYGDGITLLRFLARRFPALKIVVLTGIESELVLRSIEAAGFRCVVSKLDPAEHVAQALRAAQCGEGYLSPVIARALASKVTGQQMIDEERITKREAEVLRMFAEGFSVAEIAERLDRSPKTISSQKQSAMRKLKLGGNAEVIDYAIQHGLISAASARREDAN